MATFAQDAELFAIAVVLAGEVSNGSSINTVVVLREDVSRTYLLPHQDSVPSRCSWPAEADTMWGVECHVSLL